MSGDCYRFTAGAVTPSLAMVLSSVLLMGIYDTSAGIIKVIVIQYQFKK
jgi:hypothetical protein